MIISSYSSHSLTILLDNACLIFFFTDAFWWTSRTMLLAMSQSTTVRFYSALQIYLIYLCALLMLFELVCGTVLDLLFVCHVRPSDGKDRVWESAP